MIKIKNILKKVLIVACALFIALPAFADKKLPIGDGDINEFGLWATDRNRNLVVGAISHDVSNFTPPETNASVPVEAKLGLAFMGGLSKVGIALDYSFKTFVVVFMLLAFGFWVSFEAYNMIATGGGGKSTVKDIVVKGLILSLWIIVLKFGVAKAFMLVMTPIISLGTFISSKIWEGITSASGYSFEDFQTTCDAIKGYAVANLPVEVPEGEAETLSNMKITAETAAGMLCVPVQMSNFFWDIIRIGWKWVGNSIGNSFFGFVLGLYITYLGLKSIWKYLFIALSVIADLFMGLVLLPFTAIAETTAKTNYKGVAGDIFNSFLEIFKAETIQTQINRIIKAALYFICLAVAIGVSVSLLTFVIDPYTGQISSYMNIDGLGGALVLVLTLMLVCYMAEKANGLAEDWGGKIDSGLGDKLQNDVKGLWEKSKERWKTFRGLGDKK